MMKRIVRVLLCASLVLGTGMTAVEGEVQQVAAKETIMEAVVVAPSSGSLLQACSAGGATIPWSDGLFGVPKPKEAVGASCSCSTSDRENCQGACSYVPGCTAYSLCNPPSTYCECLCLDQYQRICEVGES